MLLKKGHPDDILQKEYNQTIKPQTTPLHLAAKNGHAEVFIDIILSI